MLRRGAALVRLSGSSLLRSFSWFRMLHSADLAVEVRRVMKPIPSSSTCSNVIRQRRCGACCAPAEHWCTVFRLATHFMRCAIASCSRIYQVLCPSALLVRHDSRMRYHLFMNSHWVKECSACSTVTVNAVSKALGTAPLLHWQLVHTAGGGLAWSHLLAWYHLAEFRALLFERDTQSDESFLYTSRWPPRPAPATWRSSAQCCTTRRSRCRRAPQTPTSRPENLVSSR